jgi:hypothetical protein
MKTIEPTDICRWTLADYTGRHCALGWFLEAERHIRGFCTNAARDAFFRRAQELALAEAYTKDELGCLSVSLINDDPENSKTAIAACLNYAIEAGRSQAS